MGYLKIITTYKVKSEKYLTLKLEKICFYRVHVVAFYIEFIYSRKYTNRLYRIQAWGFYGFLPFSMGLFNL